MITTTIMGMKNMFIVLLVVTFRTVLSKGTECSSETLPDGKTIVDCSYNGLTSFPKVADKNVTELSVVFNRISVLGEGNLSHLIHLTSVNLAHNVLGKVEQQAFQGLWKLQSVDLSYNQLTVLHSHTFHNLSSLRSVNLANNQIQLLGPDSFEGLTHLLHLDLGSNRLQVLATNTFCHLQHLSWLNVHANRLDILKAGAFFGLTNLTWLDLSKNNLDMSSSAFPPRIFAPLGKLEDLHIEFNTRASMGSYPDHVFSDLVSLRRLTIDTFADMHFGQDFSALRHINTLDLTRNCGVNRIFNNSLEGFKHSTLSEIFLDGCPVMNIEMCAFCDLPDLKRLSISGGDVLPLQFIESLYGLQYQIMSEISLTDIGQHLSVYNVIDHQVVRFLRNICVSTVNVVNCQIHRIVGSSLTNPHYPFSKCIQHLDLSNNAIVGDASAFLQMLTSFPRLQTLSIQSQRTFSLDSAKCIINQNYGCKEDMINGPKPSIVSVDIPTPENLTYFNLSSVLPHLNPLPTNLTFPTAKHLKTLDVSYIGLANCHATFYGLENLETLILDGNICNNFTDTAFDFLPSLTKLSLSSMILDQEFVSRRAKRVFQKLVRLQSLDLSFNNLVDLDPDMLQAETALRELYLAGNRLQSVSIHLEQNRELRSLDLSKNMLPTLTSAERRALDTLAERHHFSLRLQGNPLVCSCANLDLVPWLWHSSVSLDGEGRQANYTCSTESGQMTSTEQVMAHWTQHWRACVGNQAFSLALTAFVVQILGLAITFFLARSWTQLYYTWKAIRNLRLPRRQQFPKDAFLVYADVDDDVNLACVTLRQSLENRHGVRLLLRNRDEVGGHVAENICQHIDHSWKVVLLVTRSFSQDDWACGFSVTQAQRSITGAMPDRVIIIFFEDLAHLPAMPPLEMLLRMVPERNVLYIRPATPVDHPVWEVLAHMILDQPQD